MAKNDGEALFWEMLRAFAIGVGWLFVAFFRFLSVGFEFLTDHVSYASGARYRAMEKEREQQGIQGPHGPTEDLESQAASIIQKAAFPTTDAFTETIFERFISERTSKRTWPVWSVRHKMLTAAYMLYGAESFNRPPSALVVTGEIEAGRYRDRLIEHIKKLSDPGKTLSVFSRCIVASCTKLTERLPMMALCKFDDEDVESSDVINIQLLDAIPNLKDTVIDISVPFFDSETVELGLFKELREQLSANTLPSEEKLEAITREKLLKAFLKDTALATMFESVVPFALPEETRFSGHWIIAPHGTGKTTLLHSMVIGDLPKDACIILMDSKGELIAPFREMKSLQDRLVIIDPDMDHPIGFNPLDVPRTELTQATELLEYLFSSLLEFKLTPSQVSLFRNVLRALISAFPNPTLETFRDLLTNGHTKYRTYIDTLPTELQDFFRQEYDDDTTRARRREVAQRLGLLLGNDLIRAMFTANHTRFRIAEAMDAGKIIIINNSLEKLGDQGAEFFGRFFVTQVRAAGLARASRKTNQKKPVFFYIDEAHDVIKRDEFIPKIIDQLRSQNIGLILAHQRIEQIKSPDVLSALSNCAIKYANSDEDATFLAPRLRTTKEVLQNLKRGSFAAFVRGFTTNGAVTIDIPKTDFSKHPKLTAEEIQALKGKMQQEYGIIPAAPPPPPPSPPIETKSDPAPPPSQPTASPRPQKTGRPKRRPKTDE